MLHGQVTNRYWTDLYERFPACQLVLYDPEADVVLGKGNTIRICWDGTSSGLLEGVDEALEHGVRLHETGQRPTTLCAIVAVVAPDQQGRKLGGLIIEAMRDAAARQSLDSLIAPVRPTWKCRHPGTSFKDYVRWRREDGLPFDPWVRLHERLGGEILAVCPESFVVDGTVAEWERWTRLTFPESGDYEVDGALVPVTIDRQRDAGRYVEPNLWMRHEIG